MKVVLDQSLMGISLFSCLGLGFVEPQVFDFMPQSVCELVCLVGRVLEVI